VVHRLDARPSPRRTGSFKYAKREKWGPVNPIEGAEPPPVLKDCSKSPS
jgi:hypothetical protein